MCVDVCVFVIFPFHTQHGSTYGGSPLASRVGIESLKVWQPQCVKCEFGECV